LVQKKERREFEERKRKIPGGVINMEKIFWASERQKATSFRVKSKHDISHVGARKVGEQGPKKSKELVRGSVHFLLRTGGLRISQPQS